MKKNWFIGMFLIGIALSLNAQVLPSDTAHHLPEFTFKSNRFEQFTTGGKTVVTDSLVKSIMGNVSLAQLLATNSQIFIKSYGVGQLATSSFRGAGAAHTAILWNGINLQSTMHGQTDFNLIQGGLMDDIAVSYGGNSALFGGGAIGGAIALNNASSFGKQQVKYGVTLGSFEAQQHWLSVVKGNANAYVKVTGYWLEAKNNIKFYNTSLADKPLTTLPHAEQNGYGGLFDAGIKASSKNQFSFKYWYGFSDRNLPPTIGSAVSHSFQIDESHRALADWIYQQNKVKITSRIAWLNEYINYQDPSTYITGKSRANSYVAESELSWLATKTISINAGANNTFSTALSQGYSSFAERNITALFASVKYTGIKQLVLGGNIRKEWVYSNHQPFTASLGADYKLPYQFTLTAHLDKSYRLPTLNDLYWVTGNKNLKAENGFGQEIGLKKQLSSPHTFFTTQLNVFNRLVDDWIIWQPLNATWTPQNLKQVWSRGMEWSTRYTYCKNKWAISIKSDWSYVLSTNERASNNTDATVGKQLIYTPRLTHQHLISYTYSRFYVAINPTYTGYRFTTSDNSTFIDSYTFTNIYAGYGSNMRNINWQVRIQFNNCFNQSYEVLPARPMPLRNWQLTLQFSY